MSGKRVSQAEVRAVKEELAPTRELAPQFRVTVKLDPDDDVREQTENVRAALDDALRALTIPDYTIVEVP